MLPTFYNENDISRKLKHELQSKFDINLKFSENIKYKSLSDKNRLREWKLVPQRGIIEDYFGKKIADNTQTFQLHMIPEDVPNMEVLFFKLSRIIDYSERKQKYLIKKLKKRKLVF